MRCSDVPLGTSCW